MCNAHPCYDISIPTGVVAPVIDGKPTKLNHVFDHRILKMMNYMTKNE